ncbi:MAG TPA: SHOCT domain-containing protein [Mycobacterium sp.]|nr:SHOCT domain-containing protein [Mycobacterium sp.]
MNTKTRVILGAIVTLFALSLIIRFVVLSQVGMAVGWIFYLGLPIGGVVALLLLLLRLGLLNFGESPSATVQHWQHNTTGQAPASASPPSAEASRRLDELEVLRTKGAISDSEYAAQRAQIICW